MAILLTLKMHLLKFCQKNFRSNASFFGSKRYRVTTERRKDTIGNTNTLSEAVVVLKIGDKETLSVSESMDEEMNDLGPVNALSKAISKDLGQYQDIINGVRLIDESKDNSGGTSAVTRV